MTATANGSQRIRRLWTVRARLTILYGTLFLISGIVLMALTYGLVDRATREESVAVVLPDGSSVAAYVDVETDTGGVGDNQSNGAGPDDQIPDPAQLSEIAAEQHDERMLTLLTQSAIALAVVAVISVALGWLMAGHALRPLRTITATTRRITVQNLNERLNLGGPHDELNSLGDTIDDLLTRLDRSFQAQRLFIANASHELRTPLARQRALAQVALDDPEATVDTLKAAHERVLAAGAQQEHLIAALLTLARGQAGAQRLLPLELAQLTADAVTARRHDADNHRVDIVTDLSAAPVLGDVRLVQQLITNLVDNAIHHNHPAGTVRINTGVEDGQAGLTIVNTGPVVPEDALDDLVQPFRRLDAHRTRSGDGLGLGLGLSIVTAIAEAHRATLTILARAGGGLHVKVTFPAVP